MRLFVTFNFPFCSCKVLREIAEDSYVYRHVSLAKFPVVQWKSQTEEEKSFLDKCWECGNPEYLYRRGVVRFKTKFIRSDFRVLDCKNFNIFIRYRLITLVGTGWNRLPST